MQTMARSRGREKSFTRKPRWSLAEQAPAILWTTDLEFRLTGSTGAGLASLGLDAAASGQSVACLFQQSISNSKVLDAHFLAAAGETCTFEVEVQGRELEAHVEPLRDENGTIVGVAGVAIDNTERQVLERAVRIAEQNYRSLIEEAPHGICRCTLNGDLLQVNRAMQEMLGYSESDLLIRNLQTEIFADPKHYSEFVEKLESRGACHGYETNWFEQRGHPIAVSLSGRSVSDVGGNIVYLDFFAENISERKQLEEQLRQAQKMQAVGQLAGGIAHDFNNLLTVIHGQAEMMAEHLANSDPAYSRLDEIQRAAERASALTRQLLAFSRRQVLKTRILDLNSVVANINQMLARLIGRNIELSFSPDPALWPIKVDPGQVEQVLMNLAVNARDAMPGGGRVAIETRNIAAGEHFRTLPPGDFVQLSVRDTGHGMDEATRARIFEPFFTTKRAGKGTGLGLSVVYGVVKQSGGHVHVESEPGVGTTFFIYLPRSEGAAADVPQSVSVAIPQGSETVLLVEDDEPIRRMIADFLESHGYRVLVAKDGPEGLEMLESHRGIALVLSDLMMPRMGGKELAARAREILPGIKIILMSGNPEDCRLSLGGFHLLAKPFSVHTLATVVRRALDNNASFGAAAGAPS